MLSNLILALWPTFDQDKPLDNLFLTVCFYQRCDSVSKLTVETWFSLVTYDLAHSISIYVVITFTRTWVEHHNSSASPQKSML